MGRGSQDSGGGGYELFPHRTAAEVCGEWRSEQSAGRRAQAQAQGAPVALLADAHGVVRHGADDAPPLLDDDDGGVLGVAHHIPWQPARAKRDLQRHRQRVAGGSAAVMEVAAAARGEGRAGTVGYRRQSRRAAARPPVGPPFAACPC